MSPRRARSGPAPAPASTPAPLGQPAALERQLRANPAFRLVLFDRLPAGPSPAAPRAPRALPDTPPPRTAAELCAVAPGRRRSRADLGAAGGGGRARDRARAAGF